MAQIEELDFDAGLLRRMAVDDREAFEAFYLRHKARVEQMLIGVFRLDRDVSDVAQEVFMQVWMSARQYDPSRGSAVSWLLTVVRSRAIDLLRKRKRTGAESEQEISEALSEARPVGLPVIDRLWITRALEALPLHHQSTLRLAYYDGLSHSQLARKLDRPLGTVKTQIRAGLHMLRQAAGCSG